MSLLSMFDDIHVTPKKSIQKIIKTDSIIKNISDSSIQIDNYIFNCCHCFDYSQVQYGRNLIFIESNRTDLPETIKKFIVYQSLSEVGLWRLFYYNKSLKQLYKGNNDYVQQTMINFNLQNHLDHYFLHCNKSCNSDFEIYFKEFERDRLQIKKYIDEPKRQIKISPFIDNSQFNECFKMNNPRMMLELLKFSGDLNRNYNYSEPIKINNINKLINIDEDKTTAMLNGTIQSTILTPKDTNFDKVLLYFINYNLDIVTNNDTRMKDIHIKDYYAPLILLENDNITEFGIYDNYVSSGAYICKILDYIAQCPKGSDICSKHYAFIGDLYNSIYPYNKIILLKPKKLSGGMQFDNKDIKHLYLKYKNKYLELKQTRKLI